MYNYGTKDIVIYIVLTFNIYHKFIGCKNLPLFNTILKTYKDWVVRQ